MSRALLSVSQTRFWTFFRSAPTVGFRSLVGRLCVYVFDVSYFACSLETWMDNGKRGEQSGMEHCARFLLIFVSVAAPSLCTLYCAHCPQHETVSNTWLIVLGAYSQSRVVSCGDCAGLGHNRNHNRPHRFLPEKRGRCCRFRRCSYPSPALAWLQYRQMCGGLLEYLHVSGKRIQWRPTRKKSEYSAGPPVRNTLVRWVRNILVRMEAQDLGC